MNKLTTLSVMAVLFAAGNACAKNAAGGFEGPGIAPSTVAEALKMKDNTSIALTGKIVKSLGDDKYQFTDETGTIAVEIDNDDWNGYTVKPEHTVEIRGEVDKELIGAPEIDVDSVTIKK